MGIKGLSKFLKSYIPQTILNKQLSELENKVIAIDANYFMYKYTISSDDYIYKFKRQYDHLVNNQIKAVYVFDGKPPKEKKKVIEKRKEVNKKKNIDVSVDKIKDLKVFFDTKQIPYIECESEADFICCKLCEKNYIYGCISDDMDFLTLGCRYLYRDYYQHSDFLVEYNRESILSEFTNEQFIDICIFLGCDYCERVHDFVNRSIDINVFELFKTHGTLENVWNYLRQNNMFLFVDDVKEIEVQSKWQKTRQILKNDIVIEPKIIDKILMVHAKTYEKEMSIKDIMKEPKVNYEMMNRKYKKEPFVDRCKEKKKYIWDKKNYGDCKKRNFEMSNKFDLLQ